jgi:hypothetical protein
MPHLLPLDPCLFQLLISQALNSSLFGFSSSQVGTIVLPARHIHALVLHDQPIFDQHTFFLGDHQLHLFLRADRH